MDISGISIYNIAINTIPGAPPLPSVPTWTTVNGVNGQSIIWDDTRFVVEGTGAEIRTSANGTSWTTQATVTGAGGSVDITKIGSRYYLGANRYSTDLVTWSNATVSGLTAPYTLLDPVSNGSAYLTVGYTTATPTELSILTSSNGTSWTVDNTSNIQAGIRYLRGIAASSNAWVIMGTYDQSVGSNVNIYKNSVNTGWSNTNITLTVSGPNIQPAWDLEYLNNQFVTMYSNDSTYNAVLTSSDGNTWTTSNLNSSQLSYWITDIKYDGTYYLATGYGIDTSTNQYMVSISTDLNNWSNLNVPTGVGISSITDAAALQTGGNRIVVPTYGKIVYGNLTL